jgi:hypothetical protein
MVGQHDNRINSERMILPRARHSCAQGGDLIRQSARTAVRERCRKEERAAREQIPAISDHVRE